MAEKPKPAYTEKLHENDMSWEEFLKPPPAPPREQAAPLDKVPYRDQVSLRARERARFGRT
jgi:hypothetical protein